MTAAAVALHLYGLLTALFCAWTTGETVDEPLYRFAGDWHLSGRGFTSVGHPPFSLWWGALGRALTGSQELWAYRLPHVLLYAGLGAYAAGRIRKCAGPGAALIFAALYNLDPNLKAMAALHATDGDAAVLILASAAALWSLPAERADRRNAGLGFFFLGLALCAKVSTLFYLPFALALLARRFRPEEVLPAAGGLLAAFLLAYRFSLSDLSAWPQTLLIQWAKNEKGHPAWLFGRFSESGFWNYYLALFFLKTPLPALAALVAPLALRRFQPRGAFLALALPALALGAALSLGRVQTGFRYFLPGLVLLQAFAAAALATPLRARPKAALALGACLLFIDARALWKDSYLTYFNTLAPSPATRSFADSSIDWGQGLPRHLRARLPPLHDIDDEEMPELLRGSGGEPLWIAAGANQLAGIGSARGPWLRALAPTRVVAGHELFALEPRSRLCLKERAESERSDADAELSACLAGAR